MNAVYYELMDMETANVVGFDTIEAAFVIVLRAYEKYGLEGIESLALSEELAEGEAGFFAEGGKLLRLAMDAPVVQGVG